MSKKIIYLPCTKDEWSEAYTKSTKERKSTYHFTALPLSGSLPIQKI